MNDNALNANVGLKLRGLRLARNIKQADAAKDLGVSPAYLNLIEKGKRVMPFPLLWKALRYFDQDPEQFMSTLGEGRVDEALAKLLDEPLLKSLDIDPESLQSLSAEPKLAGTVAALFNLYKNTRTQLENVLAQLNVEERTRTQAGAGNGTVPGVRFDYSPFDEVSDFLETHRNYFPELEEQAEELRRDVSMERQLTSGQLIQLLEKRFGYRVHFDPAPSGSSVVRRLDPEEQTLTLSPDLTEQPLKFQIAASIGLLMLDREKLVERILGAGRTRHAETQRLIKVNLANYFAGALMLPYGDFFKEVQRTRYDVELLSSIFGSTYETVAHRLCNLSDPKRPGIPFHFLRSDIAGNISKRYSGTGIRFATGGGSCGKWAVHLAFLNPSQLTRQYSMMPDGTTYFCFAKVQLQPTEGSIVKGTAYSIGLGTHAENAKYLAYGLPTNDLRKDAIPSGISCRFCERTDCNQRAAASYRFAFAFDEYTKKDCFFSPLLGYEQGEKHEKERHAPGPSGAHVIPPAAVNGADRSEKHDSLDKAARRRKGGDA
ncbi:short-chain fatty acyl-CoA regulator family protein [Myxococcus sp. K15C18031901]|uniref:helix-turn-helix domain-containing protein n=1 Tax=Myxococcus dinghuensis TaxID=2906761 RepID=UPI0020A7EDD3|nr:helix-turn-helix transcriptional regulator [Myxococcus dinghuensis]MCP3104420.1 short-chain fatty acyl-CoA regulator family protein [Myxococcus dinghuensis]